MLVAGAKGFAKEVLEILHQNSYKKRIVFFDNISNEIPGKLYGQFNVINNFDDVINYFKKSGNNYTIGIGGPKQRKHIYNQFSNIGGKLCSVFSVNSDIGHYNSKIEEGCIIASGVIITNDVKIGKASIININSTIGHDTLIGAFTEICPNVGISGNCEIGDNVFIGTNATILPNVRIGVNSVVGAGSVVTKNIPDDTLAFGIPAKRIKSLK